MGIGGEEPKSLRAEEPSIDVNSNFGSLVLRPLVLALLDCHNLFYLPAWQKLAADEGVERVLAEERAIARGGEGVIDEPLLAAGLHAVGDGFVARHGREVLGHRKP